MGSQQRLPNGNTLITDSFAGRAFEVTAQGRMVWRFDNPARTGEAGEYVGVVPELLRLATEQAATFLEAPRSGEHTPRESAGSGSSPPTRRTMTRGCRGFRRRAMPGSWLSCRSPSCCWRERQEP